MPKPNHDPKFSMVFSVVAAGLALFTPRSFAARALPPQTSSNSDALARRDSSSELLAPAAMSVTSLLQKRVQPLASSTSLLASGDTIVEQVTEPVTSILGITVYEIQHANTNATHELKAQYFNLQDATPVGTAFSISSTTTDLGMNPSVTSDSSSVFVVYTKEWGIGITQAKKDEPRPYIAKIVSASSIIPDVFIGVDTAVSSTNLDITRFNANLLLTLSDSSDYGLMLHSLSNATSFILGKSFPYYPYTSASLNFQKGRIATFSDGSVIACYETKASPKTSYYNLVNADLTSAVQPFSSQFSLGINRQLPKVAVTTGDVAAILTLDNNGKNVYLALKNKNGSDKRAEQRVNLQSDTYNLTNHRIEVDPTTGTLAVMWDRIVGSQFVSVLRFVDNAGNIQGNKEIESTPRNNPGLPATIATGNNIWAQTLCTDTNSIDIQRYNVSNTAPQVGTMSAQAFQPNTPISISIPKSIIVDPDVDQTGLSYSVTLANGAILPSGFIVNSSGINIMIQNPGMSPGVIDLKVIATDVLGAAGSGTFRLTVSASAPAPTSAPTTAATATTQPGNSNNQSGSVASTTSSSAQATNLNSLTPSVDTNLGVVTLLPMQVPPLNNPETPVGMIAGVVVGLMLYLMGGAAAVWCLVRHRKTNADSKPVQAAVADVADSARNQYGKVELPSQYDRMGTEVFKAANAGALNNYDQANSPFNHNDYEQVNDKLDGSVRAANTAAKNSKGKAYDKVTQAKPSNYDLVNIGNQGNYDAASSPWNNGTATTFLAANVARTSVANPTDPQSAAPSLVK